MKGEPLDLLSRGNRIRLEVEGLKSSDLDRLEAEIERAGGRIVQRGPTQETLIELYRSGGRATPRT